MGPVTLDLLHPQRLTIGEPLSGRFAVVARRDQVVFGQGARAEFLNAVRHYAEAGGPAARFVDAVEATVAKIFEEPNRFRPPEAGIRSGRVPDFPYSIIFMVQERTVTILAVKHDRRDPDYWRHRLKK